MPYQARSVNNSQQRPQSGVKQGNVAGLKRALTEISDPIMGGSSLLERRGEQHTPMSTSEIVVSDNEEEGEFLTPKRARAARCSPPNQI